MKKDQKSVLKGYLLGSIVTGIFFGFLIAYLILLTPRNASFLARWIFLLPISPFSIVWLYFLFRALVPVTDGMPGKGFKQWLYGYFLLLSVLLYIIGTAFVLDLLLPTFDRDFTEMIFPMFILAATLFVLLRIPRVNRFMWRVWGTEEERREHDAKQAESQQNV